MRPTVNASEKDGRTRWRRVRTILPLFLLGACAEGPAGNQVTYNMAWLPQGSQAGVIAAQDLGYFSELGLDVNIVRGFGGIRTVNEIDQGMFEFGYGDPLSVLLNRINGGDTRMVGSINSRWPAGLCFVAERHGVETPADLRGLTIGGGQNSPVQAILPLWLEQNDVSRESYRLLQLDPSVVDAALIEGTIDAAECWEASNKPLIEHRAVAAGLTIDWISYAEFGVDMYGSGIVTSQHMITDRNNVVKSFIAATYRGYAWVIEHPQEAAELMVRRYPVLNEEITLQQIREIVSLSGDPALLGELREDRMRRTIDFLSAAYGLDAPIAAKDIYTDEFVR